MEPKKYSVWGVLFWILSTIGLFATVWWCHAIGAGSIERSSLAFALCAASFGAGSILGFVFTIFGDEKEPFGKIRDAIIALASGITGVGLAKANDVGALLGSVHIFATDRDQTSSFSILIVIAYVVVGFFFMYFFRKLALNPALAEAGSAMERLTVSSHVSMITTNLPNTLPASLLLGRDAIEDVEDLDQEEAERLRRDLFSEDVSRFLEECESNARKFGVMQPESVAMAARLHYYRTYFEKEDTDQRNAQERVAVDWAHRALMLDPTNPDLQIKLADLLQMQGAYDEAASLVERLERDTNSPQYIQQWLGYFLLFIPGRERDAIRHSMNYHARFPDDSSALYNAACGYAQIYATEIREKKVAQFLESENRLESLKLLAQAIADDSELAKLARKHSEPTASFDALAKDVDFLDLTAQTLPSPAKPTEKQTA